jgi:beta-glucosidase/6-phospho-beta-glucosidase/beta-galactosidase
MARFEEASEKRVDEWSDGFEQRFGLYRVDFDNQAQQDPVGS